MLVQATTSMWCVIITFCWYHYIIYIYFVAHILMYHAQVLLLDAIHEWLCMWDMN